MPAGNGGLAGFSGGACGLSGGGALGLSGRGLLGFSGFSGFWSWTPAREGYSLSDEVGGTGGGAWGLSGTGGLAVSGAISGFSAGTGGRSGAPGGSGAGAFLPPRFPNFGLTGGALQKTKQESKPKKPLQWSRKSILLKNFCTSWFQQIKTMHFMKGRHNSQVLPHQSHNSHVLFKATNISTKTSFLSKNL